MRIEDYALIGDTRTAALVSALGSIDWLCLPHFDAGACFAALLGGREHGRWRIGPAAEQVRTRRRYRKDTLVLETEFATDTGRVRLVDLMPPGEDLPNVVRVVEGLEGRVEMRMDLVIRFDYGWVVPWIRRSDGGLLAVGGPDALELRTPIDLEEDDRHVTASFEVEKGDRVPFLLTWHASHDAPPDPVDPLAAVEGAEAWWREWAGRCTYDGPERWRDAVVRSLITLKALTFVPTGAIVGAPTTSLPEAIGGERNWDYRFTWLRDATFTLTALLASGFRQEARAWRDWLLRTAAGAPDQLQILYGIRGERRTPEVELKWLPGYEKSVPVRAGNAAGRQRQLDVFGEVLDALHTAWLEGLSIDGDAWKLQCRLLQSLEAIWREPDAGIWESRGEEQHFTHSRMMAWVAFDRGVKGIEQAGLEGPLDHWRAIRDEIHGEVCEKGWNDEVQAFTQIYGGRALDAALLTMPLVGFLPPDDPRVLSTVRAIERELTSDGLVLRYDATQVPDGLPPGEGRFLLCSFWLADNYVLQGRKEEAIRLFDRLIALCNDVGLLAEQYDPESGRQLGNFPQAFSHVGLVNTALNLGSRHPPAREREQG